MLNPLPNIQTKGDTTVTYTWHEYARLMLRPLLTFLRKEHFTYLNYERDFTI